MEWNIENIVMITNDSQMSQISALRSLYDIK